MHRNLVVLNASGFAHSDVARFCLDWSYLEGSEYKLYSLTTPVYRLRHIDASDVDVGRLFRLEQDLKGCVVMYFIPSIGYRNQAAPKKLFEQVVEQSRVVQTTILSRTITSKLLAGKINVYNKAYL